MSRVESQIQADIRVVFHKHGWLTNKIDPGEGVEAGWPDLECYGPVGRIVFIEVKKPDGSVSPIQAWQHERLRLLGHDVRVMDNKDQAVAFFVMDAASRGAGR
jgi:hypothetical protein